ncbi:uncharacterized protein EV422DRAFT_497562 [Fimicolochytrium jonesii]|uniref:uncharacterized protein n=1 Tax=Fimicolochytrium jonesii TaxID=1396493 RepID=UPI0022FE505B|nr:uncharacterized protein EV422DRAFT_497562 [Fimicolochytrium jonesii]KAI8819752.1 hypothetical protein EV422DRAFT_497562 [Fimicolochytrium jonesii]
MRSNVLLALSHRNEKDLPASVFAEFIHNQTQQQKVASLKAFPHTYEALKSAIQQQDYSSWPGHVWAHNLPPSAGPQELALWQVFRYALTDLHQKLDVPHSNSTTNERTEWIRRVIPFLEAVHCNTTLLRIVWCEYPAWGSQAALLSERNYQAKRPKMWVGMGLDPGSNSELMIMEASSNSRTKENATHSIDDSAKIIELCTNALKLELLKHKEAAYTTVNKKCVLGFHFIVDRITLTMTTLEDRRWKVVQLRSAEIPMRWRERSKVLQVCELVAAAYSTLLEQQELMERICEEESGAIEVPEEERARQVLKKLSITACEP